MFRMMLWLMTLIAGIAVPAVAAPPPAAPLVLAAASLQESLTAAADAWARKGHPKPVVSFAASSALARQVLAGAPADLFISADEEWMDQLAAKRLIAPGTRASFLGNRLVLVTGVRNGARVDLRSGRPIVAALGAGRLAMADPDSVPAGRYGRAALTRLGAWTALEAKVVRAENVRAALLLVERDAAAFGIVYATDAQASTKVRVAGVFPATSHAAITYPIARLTASRNPEAEGFRRFLVSREGKAIFARFGFLPR
ncbi:molybdate ABC transporter substrate-binding protein [Sphingomonas sp. ERG5]|uniref:molybdate ABC transporter substrate-binding protein n=1 Tax=Sphingomonas sp. ERG5 TaxID=1381597 RepID=UPI00054B44D0